MAQDREIIEAPDGRSVQIITSYSDTRACLDWYLMPTPTHLGAVLGGEGPFPVTELQDRLAALRLRCAEKLTKE